MFPQNTQPGFNTISQQGAIRMPASLQQMNNGPSGPGTGAGSSSSYQNPSPTPSPGINVTGSAAPGTTSVGGIMQLRSLRQVEADRQEALIEQMEPELQNLAQYVKKCWWVARASKETTVEGRMLQSLRQRRGEYDPQELALLKEMSRSTLYMFLTSNKCRAALGWLKDVLVTTSENKPWCVDPEPVAEVPPNLMTELMQTAQQTIQQMEQQAQQSGSPPPSDFDIREMMMALKDQALAHVQQTAKDSAERMERKMETQLFEGGFIEQFALFLDDLTTFPSAIFKGPVVRNKPRLKWKKQGNDYVPEVQDQLVLEWERVDPFMVYPAPDASRIEDSWLIERHRMERGDLVALKGVEGYSDVAIDLVLYEYGRGGLHEWLAVDTAKATAEGKSTLGFAQNPSELIDALQFWGPIQGRLLLEWGMSKKQVPDPMKDYMCEIWCINNIVIKATLNQDPLGRKPYYKASWEEVPGAFWGNSVADLCRDTQKICNAAARAIVDNMGIASGPQVVVNVDRVPIGENLTQIYPWKIHQVTRDPDSSNRPPVEFFQPSSVVQELLQIYEKFATLADEYTGIPRYMTGDAQVGGAARTASGMSMLMGNAGKSIKQVISNIDVHVLAKAVDRLYFYNMRYGSDPDLKLAGVQVLARGADALLIKESAQQRQNEFLQIATSNPLVQQIIGNEGIAALIRENAKTLDLDVDSIVPPLPVLRKKWADAAAAAAAQQKQQIAQAQADKQQEAQLEIAIAQATGKVPPGMPGWTGGNPVTVPKPPQAPNMPVLPQQARALGLQGAIHPGGPPGQAPDQRSLMNGAPVTNQFSGKNS